MKVHKYNVITDFTVFDILFLRGDTIYMSEKPEVKVFKDDKTYLGTITKTEFNRFSSCITQYV